MSKKWLKKENLVFIIGLMGIVLIGFSQFLFGSSKTVKSTVTEPVAIDKQSYEEKIEQRLCDILGSISGVGQVKVMITLSEGYSYEYAMEQKVNDDRYVDNVNENGGKTQEKRITEESFVLIEATKGQESPIVTKEVEPKIKGVVIVCEGGNKPDVMYKVMEAVSVALNISSTQISILEMTK